MMIKVLAVGKEGGERAQAVYSKKIGNQDDIINLDIINLE